MKAILEFNLDEEDREYFDAHLKGDEIAKAVRDYKLYLRQEFYNTKYEEDKYFYKKVEGVLLKIFEKHGISEFLK